ncbi:MAG: hypothetical protein D6677_03450 [Calditrichaeota bacterium]|nr:MAG: hypothetical protein D6677_03450 [Calditrichota bacterium]
MKPAYRVQAGHKKGYGVEHDRGLWLTVLKFSFREFIYGGHLQSLGAAAIASLSGLVMGRPVSPDVFWAVYFIFYPLYLYNRYVELEKDTLTNPERSKHFNQYVQIMPVVMWAVVCAVILWVIYYSNYRAMLFSLSLLALGLLYTTRFKSYTKKIFLFKDVYVAGFFAVLVYFPMVYQDWALPDRLFVKIHGLATFIFLKAFFMQVFLDIKDIQSDKRENLRTVPVLLGRDRALRLLLVVDMAVTTFFPFLFFYLFDDMMPLKLFLPLSLPLLGVSFYLAHKKNYAGYVWRSAEFFIWLPMVLVLSVML